MSVFISYRRDDSHYIADRIYDWLIRKRGRRNIFKDVDAIPPGQDFRQVIHAAVGRCDALLVVIGPGWLTAAKAPGMRRLDDPNDFVRMEIEAAIKRDIPIIPLLVNNATTPTAEDLPPSLQTLAWRHGLLVRPDPDFHNDMGRLIAALSNSRRQTITPLRVLAIGAALALLLAILARIGQPRNDVKTPVSTTTTTKEATEEVPHPPSPPLPVPAPPASAPPASAPRYPTASAPRYPADPAPPDSARGSVFYLSGP